jgi:FMN-dependent NADH-azoreductase
MDILHLISSPRKKESFSIRLGNEIVNRLLNKHPGSKVVTSDLTQMNLPHLEEVHLRSFGTEIGSRTQEEEEAIRYSDEAIKDLFAADTIVIGVPMYNFSIPSALKAWLDHILRAGKTFRYTSSGVEGLVEDKKVYLAIASGGVYSDGPMHSFDFTEPYLRKVLGFIGISDVEVFRVEGVALPELKDAAYGDTLSTLSV